MFGIGRMIYHKVFPAFIKIGLLKFLKRNYNERKASPSDSNNLPVTAY
jgi:hypothetical protein